MVVDANGLLFLGHVDAKVDANSKGASGDGRSRSGLWRVPEENLEIVDRDL